MVAVRSLLLVPVLLVVSAGLFAAASISPFDPLVGFLGERYVTASEADKALIAGELGVHIPWYEVYWAWLHSVVTGELGFSRSYSQPVSQVLFERVPATVLLVGVAMSLSVAAALLLGVWTGMRRGGLIDRTVASTCVMIQGLPPFVLALAAIGIFGVGLGWLPVAGHLLLPALVLGLSQLPWMLLAVRESVSANRGADYVAGALARGIDTATITRRHILPSSLAPFVTIVGARLPEVVVGAVLVEEIFSWPGIAEALVQSAYHLDMPLLAVITVGTTGAVMVGSLLADLACVLLDPRVRADG